MLSKIDDTISAKDIYASMEESTITVPKNNDVKQSREVETTSDISTKTVTQSPIIKKKQPVMIPEQKRDKLKKCDKDHVLVIIQLVASFSSYKHSI